MTRHCVLVCVFLASFVLQTAISTAPLDGAIQSPPAGSTRLDALSESDAARFASVLPPDAAANQPPQFNGQARPNGPLGQLSQSDQANERPNGPVGLLKPLKPQMKATSVKPATVPKGAVDPDAIKFAKADAKKAKDAVPSHIGGEVAKTKKKVPEAEIKRREAK